MSDRKLTARIVRFLRDGNGEKLSEGAITNGNFNPPLDRTDDVLRILSEHLMEYACAITGKFRLYRECKGISLYLQESSQAGEIRHVIDVLKRDAIDAGELEGHIESMQLHQTVEAVVGEFCDRKDYPGYTVIRRKIL